MDARLPVLLVAGALALVGAFAPWYAAVRVDEPPMGEPTRVPVALRGGELAYASAALLALALGTIPLAHRAGAAWARVALLAAAPAVALLSLAGPGGFVFGWGGVFVRYERVEAAWGLYLLLAGSLAALAASIAWSPPRIARRLSTP